jgi:hypothetical protein
MRCMKPPLREQFVIRTLVASSSPAGMAGSLNDQWVSNRCRPRFGLARRTRGASWSLASGPWSAAHHAITAERNRDSCGRARRCAPYTSLRRPEAYLCNRLEISVW